MTPKETLAQAMADLDLTVESVFVPWSRSRNYKPEAKTHERSLNWRVTLKRGGREVISTDYSAGIGHAPSYKHVGFSRMPADVAKAIEFETEHGKTARLGANTGHTFAGKPIALDSCDVVFGLVSDSDAIDCASFEEWASNLGYDSDSRSAEKTYRACLDIALKLRAAVGDGGLTKLRNACQDY